MNGYNIIFNLSHSFFLLFFHSPTKEFGDFAGAPASAATTTTTTANAALLANIMTPMKPMSSTTQPPMAGMTGELFILLMEVMIMIQEYSLCQHVTDFLVVLTHIATFLLKQLRMNKVILNDDVFDAH